MENKKEIYTPMEALLINAMVRRQERENALETKRKTTEALALDLVLLELEEQVGLLDGLKQEDWAE